MNAENKHKAKMKLITGLNLLLALFFTYLLLKNDIDTRIFKTHAFSYATIKSVSHDSDSDVNDYTFSYTIDGKKYTKECYDESVDYKLDDKAKICYKISNPDKCELYDMRISIILFILLYVGTSIYLFTHSSELKEKHTISINGEVINEDIDSKKAMRIRMEEAKKRRDSNKEM